MVAARETRRDRLAIKGRVPTPRRRRLGFSPGRAAFYALALAFIVLGVVMGALSVNMMSPQASAEMVDILEGAVHVWHVPGYVPPSQEIFNHSAGLHLKAGLILWLCGLTALGLPVIVLVLFVRGFALGFTAGALIYRHGVQGLGLSLTALVPGNLFLLPAFCLLGGQAFFFTLGRMMDRAQGTPSAGPGAGRLLHHLVIGMVAAVLVLAGTLVEGYFAPVFLRWIIPLLG